MNVVQPLPRDEGSWTARYEDLRQHALGGPAPTGGDAGLDVLLQRGMAGWMGIASNLRPVAASSATLMGWGVADHDAATLVLAEMALPHVVHPERKN
jgi:hypothetical protein